MSRRRRRRNPETFFNYLKEARKTGEKLHEKVADFSGEVYAVIKAGEGMVDADIQRGLSKTMVNLQEAAMHIKGARHRLDDIAKEVGVE